MIESDKLVVPYTCPQRHQGTSSFTKEDLEKAIAAGVLTCLCEQCGASYSSNLAEADIESIQKLIDHASGEQLPQPTSPESERA